MKFIVAGLLVVLWAAPSHAQNKDILQLQRDVLDVTERVKQIQTMLDQNNTVVKSLVEKMADQVGTLASSTQKISQTVDALKSQDDTNTREMRAILTTLNTTVKDLEESMSSVRSQINSVTRELTTIKTTAEPLAGPNDLWRTAYADYSAGIYDLAISGLQEFLSKYPTDPRAPDTHLLLGDAQAAQKKFDVAITEYDFVLQKFPESDKTRAALLKKGLALAETNQPQQAIQTLNEVVKKFPNTSEATSATTRIRELQAALRKPPAR